MCHYACISIYIIRPRLGAHPNIAKGTPHFLCYGHTLLPKMIQKDLTFIVQNNVRDQYSPIVCKRPQPNCCNLMAYGTGHEEGEYYQLQKKIDYVLNTCLGRAVESMSPHTYTIRQKTPDYNTPAGLLKWRTKTRERDNCR